VEVVEERIEAIRQQLKSIEEARNNETKSSAGDKYETSRAMMHMEEEKSRVQMTKTNQLRLELKEIDPAEIHQIIKVGSLVHTDSGKYFISVGLGKIKIKEEVVYCISMGSPLGQQLRGKSVGDEILMGGRSIEIKDIN